MRTTFIVMGLLLTVSASWAARTTKIGKITAAEAWSDTILMTGDVICSNAVVTIQPGAVVLFDTANQRVTAGESDATHIHLIIKRNGAMNAVGTAQSPILFTTTSAIKTGGKWGEIDIMAAIDTAHTAFTHCIFECGSNAFDFRTSTNSGSPNTVKSRSRFTIDQCEIRTMTSSGLYITSGGSPVISNCLMHDINSTGVFAHGGETVDIRYCTISNVSVGLINVGEPSWGWNQTMTVDHVTIDSVNGARSSSNQWWTGMGIYCVGDSRQRATLNLTNTIVAHVARFTNRYALQSVGLFQGACTVTEDYNCFFNTGYYTFDNGSPNTHDSEDDPQFVNVQDPTQGLAWNSPCLNAASDGQHIGAWQGTVGLQDAGQPSAFAATVRVQPNPFTAQAVFILQGKRAFSLSIFTLDGKAVKKSSAASGRATWDGTDQTGGRVVPGVYLYRLSTGGRELSGRVVRTK